MPKLVITDSEGSRTLGLERELKAGRLADNDIPLKVPEASRHHCRFFEEKGTWFVEDLGSSNGTLVNGRKVSKFELQDGDLIAIGAVTLRFLDSAPTAEETGGAPAGWGDDELSLEEPEAPPPPPPARKQPSTPVAAASPGRPAPAPVEDFAEAPFERRENDTKMLDAESAFTDPTFSLADVPEKKSIVPSLLAGLLLLSLAGGLVWLYLNREKLAGGRATSETTAATAASNLVPRKFASFEPHEAEAGAETEAGWHKEDPIDPAAAGEVQDPVHSGDQAFSIARRPVEKAPPATWVVLSGSTETDVSILPGSVYRLGAMVQVVSGQPVPGVAVTWIDMVGEDVREIAREVVAGPSNAKQWTLVSGFVQAPEGASRARVGLVAAGIGEAAFDDVIFDSAQAPAGRGATIKDFHAWLTPSGGLRLFHFARPVSDGIGVWKTGEAGLEPPWRVFQPKAQAGEALAGTLRDGGDASVALAADGTTFQATWQLPSAAGHTIVIPLPGGADAINVTLLDGARAKRMRSAFQTTQATGLIVGGQGDRVRIKFLDGEKKPFAAALDVVTDSDRAFVKLDRGDRTAITFEFETSFDAEMNEARGLLAKAEEAARAGRVGEAMAAYEEVLAKFPFDENLEKDASKKHESLANEGRNKARAHAARVDDAKFFRTARLDDDLLAELEADVSRYAGTNLAADFAARRDELKAERAKTAAEKRESAARAAFSRAKDYYDGKEKRRELTMAFLELVVNKYPETEWAQQARALLDQLKGGKSEGAAQSRPESAPASPGEAPR
jgi:hypothetical protein